MRKALYRSGMKKMKRRAIGDNSDIGGVVAEMAKRRNDGSEK